MQVGRYVRLALAIVGIWASLDSKPTVASEAESVLLNPARFVVQTGRHSKFAAFQAKLQAALTECGVSDVVVMRHGEAPTGKMDSTTRAAIQRLQECGSRTGASFGGATKEGAITVGLWRALMGREAVPTVAERAKALVLSFEATDFGDAPEWNLCQDGIRARPGPLGRKRNNFRCFNESDPCSFLTWGPRGATAGSGREIQYILWLLMKRDPDLVRRAFGSEYPNISRFIALKGGNPGDCRGNVPLKQFVCAIWINDQRRQIWEGAFASLGHAEVARQTYEQLYSLREFDGAKLESFYALWHNLKLKPSQVDYAFFIDRITHLGGPPEESANFAPKMSTCIKQEAGALSTNGAARRCLGRLQTHPTQANMRVARDVAYYIDSYPEGALSAAEIEAWGGYIPLSAIFNLGLSDGTSHSISKFADLASLGPGLPVEDDVNLTLEELTSCPQSVLAPEPRRQ